MTREKPTDEELAAEVAQLRRRIRDLEATVDRWAAAFAKMGAAVASADVSVGVQRWKAERAEAEARKKERAERKAKKTPGT